jgi:trehalose/maltose hydrolase-like predicted phosphorylase
MKLIAIFLLAISTFRCVAQNDAWLIEAKGIDPNHYYGVTLANGMIGLVSSPEPMKVKDVVLNGVYDYYQRGRVSNILKTFNHVNMNLDIDGQRISLQSISNYQQVLDMKKARADLATKGLVTEDQVTGNIDASNIFMNNMEAEEKRNIADIKAAQELKTPIVNNVQ